jgi:hypothetical protein
LSNMQGLNRKQVPTLLILLSILSFFVKGTNVF